MLHLTFTWVKLLINTGNNLCGDSSPPKTLNNLKLITGSPGGSKIPDINLQVVLNVVDFGLDIGAATMMPRIHQDYQSVEMDIEKFLNFDTRRILKIYGHKLEESDTIGSTQSILIDGDSKYGYADLRRPNAKVSIQK